MGRYLLLLLALHVRGLAGQLCPVDIPDAERRECYPWADPNQADCEARGCVWCASQEVGYPYCFYNTKVCPSEVPEASRVDCMPEGGGRSDCLKKNCLWCETEAAGIPFCFDDPDSSLGGENCLAEFPEAERIDCHPDVGATSQACLDRGCYWCGSAAPNAPWCFMPKQNGYRMEGSPVQTPQGYQVALTRVNSPSLFGQDIQQLSLDIEFQTQQRLRLKFYDAAEARFEVPVVISGNGTAPVVRDYDVTFSNDPVFSFQVTRISTGATIFDSSIGGLQFADQFIQIATYLDSDKVYGFGEHEKSYFKHDMNWVTWAMWTRDQMVTSANLYGQHPFYMNVEQTNDAHGVLFLNANAQEVTLMPAPGLQFRTIGGILDIYIFMGPSPEDVIKQYTSAIGTPVMPPYWSLGFQLCRWGYTDLDHMKAAVDRTRFYDIPHDIQYGDIDYMDAYKDFTLDPVNFGGLPDYIQQLKAEGTRFVIILDPGIYTEDPPGEYLTFDRGQAQNVWVRDPTGTAPQEGQVWPGQVYYPDFTRAATQDWWTDECVRFTDVLDYAGLWIDMNEPSSFVDGSNEVPPCNDNRYNEPPFVPAISDGIWIKTYCMDTLTDLGLSYNAHSLYGWSMAKQSLPAARTALGTRSIVFSRSTFPGAGQWGQHWLGDNFSQWYSLRVSIIGLLEFNMFGMPYVGADICGFSGVTTEELCRRWQQLGAFYPFSRNHNAAGEPDQDPGMWETVAADTRKTLLIRYRLLPYLYTLLHKAHVMGGTVVRSLMFEFISDVTTHEIDAQFLWGSAFMISPALDQGVTTVDAYFPDARWFDYYTGSEEAARGGFTTLDTPIDDINLHYRGGYIIPVQQPANSTVWSRGNPMGLVVALDDSGSAAGDLWWDDGETIDTHGAGEYFMGSYSASAGVLTGTVNNDGYTPIGSLNMDDFEILGAGAVTSITINGAPHSDWDQDSTTLRVTIRNGGLPVNSEFTVTWS